jgi:hypothetical protein
MRDLFSCISRTPAAADRSARSKVLPPLAIDSWIASSLLQKAIRRGDADLAERAAITLHRLRGNGIWRRYLVIAFEDVSIASVDALIKTTAACTAPDWRASVDGGDERVLCLLARLLAEAPKDRSPDHLISVAQSHPELEDNSDTCILAIVRTHEHAIERCAEVSGDSSGYFEIDNYACVTDSLLERNWIARNWNSLVKLPSLAQDLLRVA